MQFNAFTFFAFTQLHNLIYIWKRPSIMCGKYLPERFIAEDLFKALSSFAPLETLGNLRYSKLVWWDFLQPDIR